MFHLGGEKKFNCEHQLGSNKWVELQIVNHKLRTANCKSQTADCKLRTTNYEFTPNWIIWNFFFDFFVMRIIEALADGEETTCTAKAGVYTNKCLQGLEKGTYGVGGAIPTYTPLLCNSHECVQGENVPTM